jgi:hypothetical protein
MANTTNFGWETPDDTDLVKDGALAMRTLGNAIDTSLVDLKGGTTGQVLSKTSNTDMDFTWTSPNPGDITEVTVSSPITGGGSSGSVNIAIQDGTTAQKGAVQLEDSTSSTSTTKAATPNSVKTSYDLANAAIPKSLVDAKADLITATADNTPARLAVGSNGDTLVADSAATTGLRWQGNYAAGKNAIINGDFRINQRAFTSITTTAQYGFDRWALGNAGNFGTVTYTPQNFTLGTAPVAGYEGTTFARITTTGQTQTGVRTALRQPIESVRTLANSTVTVSFWAKAASGTPKIAINLEQQFGTGGSPSANVDNYLGQATLSTSWARYSVTGSIASISGKTIGTNNNDLLMLHLVVSAGSDFNSSTGSLGIQSNTFDLWGVQVEQGSTATAFQTATGTLQGELAACQRYFQVLATGNSKPLNVGFYNGASRVDTVIPFKVTMRTAPTASVASGTNYYQIERDGVADTFNDLTLGAVSTDFGQFYVLSNVSGTTGWAGAIYTNNASASITVSAEL